MQFNESENRGKKSNKLTFSRLIAQQYRCQMNFSKQNKSISDCIIKGFHFLHPRAGLQSTTLVRMSNVAVGSGGVIFKHEMV